MNKKAQTGIVAYFAMLFFFLAFWALFLAEYLSGIGARAITNNSLTGLEAFGMANINLWVFLGVLIAGAVGVYSAQGGGQV